MAGIKSDFQVATERIESALKKMRMAKQDVADAEANLAECQTLARQAEEDFNAARAAFLDEFPEMAPAQVATAQFADGPDIQANVLAAKEATPVPVITSQGPVVFREMDDSPFGDDR